MEAGSGEDSARLVGVNPPPLVPLNPSSKFSLTLTGLVCRPVSSSSGRQSSTRDLNLFKTLLNRLKSFLLRVHLSCLRHQSRIWVSILTLDYLSTNRYLNLYVKRHISTSVPYATFDHLSPLRQLNNSAGCSRITARLLQLSTRWHIRFQPGPPPVCSEYPCTRCGPTISL